MLIAVDIGNTNISFGFFDQDELVYEARIKTVKNQNYHTYQKQFTELISNTDLNLSLTEGAILSSVVPVLNEIFVKLLQEVFGVSAIIVDHNSKTNLNIMIEHPEELGSDRLVNSAGAFDKFRTSLIVIDMGTATTFDCVTSGSEYLGGIIAPGISIISESLTSKTSKLPEIILERPKNVIGKNTVECMQSGIINGYISLVDGLIVKLKKEMGTNSKVVVTGGLADLIIGETIENIEEFKHLTLYGLRLLYELNS